MRMPKLFYQIIIASQKKQPAVNLENKVPEINANTINLDNILNENDNENSENEVKSQILDKNTENLSPDTKIEPYSNSVDVLNISHINMEQGLELEEARKENQELKEKIFEYENIKNMLEKERDELNKQLENERVEWNKQLTDIKNEKNEKSQLKNEAPDNKDLLNSIISLLKILNMIKLECKKMGGSIDDNNYLQISKKSLNLSIEEELKIEVTNMESVKKLFLDTMKEMNSNSLKLSEAQEKLNRLAKENEKFRGLNEKLVGENDKLVGEKDKLFGENEKLLEEISQQKNQISNYDNELINIYRDLMWEKTLNQRLNNAVNIENKEENIEIVEEVNLEPIGPQEENITLEKEITILCSVIEEKENKIEELKYLLERERSKAYLANLKANPPLDSGK